MKKLILMRHAKSDWSNGLPDFDRPLNKRGCQDAPRMAGWLEQQGMVPDLILCSAAARTRETHARLIEIWSEPCETIFKEQLYHAPSEIILSNVQQADDTYSAVMVLAHNPGIHDAALRLLSNQAAQSAGDLYMKFPTATIAVIEFPIQSWAELKWRRGSLTAFQTPKELNE